MFHGGTDFGWMNGANSNEDEVRAGRHQLRLRRGAGRERTADRRSSLLPRRDRQSTGVTPPPVPEVAPPIHIAPFKLTEAASLWNTLPKPIESDHPLTMEDVGQNYG